MQPRTRSIERPSARSSIINGIDYAEDAKIEPHIMFQELNEKAKSPFSAFVQIDDKYLLSSSPERFLKRVGNRLISQPIKGTAQRHIDMVQDAAEASQLQRTGHAWHARCRSATSLHKAFSNQ